MKTSQQKCIEHAREKLERLRELSFGCELFSGEGDLATFVTKENQYQTRSFLHKGHNRVYQFQKSEFEKDYPTILGHPPRLSDWLELLGDKTYTLSMSGGLWDFANSMSVPVLKFNLSTGNPATDKDWDTLAELLGLV